MSLLQKCCAAEPRPCNRTPSGDRTWIHGSPTLMDMSMSARSLPRNTRLLRTSQGYPGSNPQTGRLDTSEAAWLLCGTCRLLGSCLRSTHRGGPDGTSRTAGPNSHGTCCSCSNSPAPLRGNSRKLSLSNHRTLTCHTSECSRTPCQGRIAGHDLPMLTGKSKSARSLPDSTGLLCTSPGCPGNSLRTHQSGKCAAAAARIRLPPRTWQW